MSDTLMDIVPVLVKVVVKDPKWLPAYQSAGASGADLLAAIDEKRLIPSGESALIPTGLFIEVPEGYEAQIRSRSGLALKHQVHVLNSPGTVDSDYRGEVGVILMNHGVNAFTVEPNMRIAQMVIAPVSRAQFVLKDSLGTTTRNMGGFGHTGIL